LTHFGGRRRLSPGGNQVADDGDDSKPPLLKVVSENPNAHVDRQIVQVKKEAQRALTQFAAALLRVIAGGGSEATYLIRRLSLFIDAQNALNATSGQWLTTAELEEALRLPQADLDSSLPDDWSHRRWLRESGMESIVQGALRLAAHHLLDERPAFGGKNSEHVIMDGIKTLEELKRPLPQPSESKRKGLADNWKGVDLGPSEIKSAPKRAFGQRREFSQEDLKELRKAIKAKDEKRIAELTAKIRKPSSDK
jgi:hypothetical protein